VGEWYGSHGQQTARSSKMNTLNDKLFFLRSPVLNSLTPIIENYIIVCDILQLISVGGGHFYYSLLARKYVATPLDMIRDFV
jgi:hypothetical protein